jgi:dTDP-4-dehydrorhamnose reductase
LRTLITGAGGQLGRELQSTCPDGVELVACDLAELDISDTHRLETTLGDLRPAVVINAAAYTAVDRAEQEKDKAFAVNATGAGNLARVAESLGARMIHISTDFVFAGERNRSYPPDAETDPLGVYGASKLAGELAVMEATNERALVLRTAWVYSRFGQNFVKTMLRLMAERPELTVVCDQIGTPTWARGLATVIWSACEHQGVSGIYHWTDAGVASWYDFAIAIQDEATLLGLAHRGTAIAPISSEDYPTPARRPRFSVLDTTATSRDLDIQPTHWRHQLKSMLQDLHEYGEN